MTAATAAVSEVVAGGPALAEARRAALAATAARMASGAADALVLAPGSHVDARWSGDGRMHVAIAFSSAPFSSSSHVRSLIT